MPLLEWLVMTDSMCVRWRADGPAGFAVSPIFASRVRCSWALSKEAESGCTRSGYTKWGNLSRLMMRGPSYRVELYEIPRDVIARSKAFKRSRQ